MEKWLILGLSLGIYKMSLGHLIVLENKETLKKIIKLRVYIKGTPKLMEGAPKGQSWKNWGKKKDLIQSIK